MSDLIEKVSRAIAPHWWAGVDAAPGSERNWLINVQAHVFNLRRAKDVVLVVLSAIREPTEAVYLARPVIMPERVSWPEIWSGAIDAKIKEIEEE